MVYPQPPAERRLMRHDLYALDDAFRVAREVALRRTRRSRSMA